MKYCIFIYYSIWIYSLHGQQAIKEEVPQENVDGQQVDAKIILEPILIEDFMSQAGLEEVIQISFIDIPDDKQLVDQQLLDDVMQQIKIDQMGPDQVQEIERPVLQLLSVDANNDVVAMSIQEGIIPMEMMMTDDRAVISPEVNEAGINQKVMVVPQSVLTSDGMLQTSEYMNRVMLSAVQTGEAAPPQEINSFTAVEAVPRGISLRDWFYCFAKRRVGRCICFWVWYKKCYNRRRTWICRLLERCKNIRG